MSDTANLQKTPLYDEHVALGARIVDFGGWALPVSYKSQIEEHHAVRNKVGMFDVSHMTVSDVTGADTIAFFSRLLANDINKITGTPGKALYSCMLNDEGGVIDDLIVYYLSDNHCRIVTNAATNEKDMAWLNQQAAAFSDITMTEKPDLALIAVQGPEAIQTLTSSRFENIAGLVTGLKRFQGAFLNNNVNELFIGRTGYTGEDGVEIILPSNQAADLWQQLLDADVQPCGLGARDTLRLEAGMALYGSDLDEQHTPLDCGLSWTVAMKDEREFIGRTNLVSPSTYQMVGLILEGKGVLRGHQSVHINGNVVGETTSGGFSPTLNQSIALARVTRDAGLAVGDQVQVEIRKRLVDASVEKYPFLSK